MDEIGLIEAERKLEAESWKETRSQGKSEAKWEEIEKMKKKMERREIERRKRERERV